MTIRARQGKDRKDSIARMQLQPHATAQPVSLARSLIDTDDADPSGTGAGPDGKSSGVFITAPRNWLTVSPPSENPILIFITAMIALHSDRPYHEAQSNGVAWQCLLG